MLRSFVAMFVFLLATVPVMSETTAILQTEVEGRADVDRNRLVMFNTMPDEREVLLLLSCRTDDQTLGAALDLSTDQKWDIAGEDVTLAMDDAEPTVHRFTVTEEFLGLGGDAAEAVFSRALEADRIRLTARDDITASFDLLAISDRVGRFRSLCGLNS